VGHVVHSCAVRGGKYRCTTFHARVGMVRFTEKARRDKLHRACIFASVGSAGHVVHSGASVARNVDALFCMLMWVLFFSINSALGHVTLCFCFCIPWDLRVTECNPVRAVHKTSMHYFSFSAGPDAVSVKTCRDTFCRTCVFASSGICG
jgi:hypothetical protein